MIGNVSKGIFCTCYFLPSLREGCGKGTGRDGVNTIVVYSNMKTNASNFNEYVLIYKEENGILKEEIGTLSGMD